LFYFDQQKKIRKTFDTLFENDKFRFINFILFSYFIQLKQYQPTEVQTTESNNIDREDPFPIPLPNAESNNQNNRDTNELPEDSFDIITTDLYEETTTYPPTTTTVEKTTIPTSKLAFLRFHH
jgi:hypothetical protein